MTEYLREREREREKKLKQYIRPKCYAHVNKKTENIWSKK